MLFTGIIGERGRVKHQAIVGVAEHGNSVVLITLGTAATSFSIDGAST